MLRRRRLSRRTSRLVSDAVVKAWADHTRHTTNRIALDLICGLADMLERKGRTSITVDELRLWAMDLDADEVTA